MLRKSGRQWLKLKAQREQWEKLNCKQYAALLEARTRSRKRGRAQAGQAADKLATRKCGDVEASLIDPGNGGDTHFMYVAGVLLNMHEHMQEGARIHWWLGLEALARLHKGDGGLELKAALEGRGTRTVIVHTLPSTFDRDEYNSLMRGPEFWQAFCAHKVLVMEVDSIICAGSPHKLSGFMHLDYVGSQTHWMPQGNGGFALLDRKRALDCVVRPEKDRCPPHSKPGAARCIWGQDAYLSTCIQRRGGKIGTKEEQARFGTQNVFLHKSFGAHQIYRQQPSWKSNGFDRFCPEYRKVHFDVGDDSGYGATY
jgi:hypothetical protein